MALGPIVGSALYQRADFFWTTVVCVSVCAVVWPFFHFIIGDDRKLNRDEGSSEGAAAAARQHSSGGAQGGTAASYVDSDIDATAPLLSSQQQALSDVV